MNRPDVPDRRTRRPPRPLDAALLDELALGYVARFATSTGKLSAYLNRKLRERGWDEDAPSPPDVAAIITRMAEAGYVSDEGYARMRGASLRRRGLGARRIAQDLGQAGIAPDLREEAMGSAQQARAAALALARKRRLGPFGPRDDDGRIDPAVREKQVAVFLRAGHPLAMARALVNAAGEREAEDWVYDADD
ncbi:MULTISPECIES: RecX family transcriptional regulator [unclassified Novosphingobium]|uniref:RecX family transcriptional regulator n=1 Tax=unclassified Novosphingobium TaxID=2644732 RepID=UPI0014424B53|nr:regulatory protein [Novosphingobium sp. BK256]MBB3375710.1 regulatory protein [Novosphingobium sp. BK280]MBB3380123.1 regulatory protein [Novosphingobium sp. BK258]MBB3421817.1 regulatory protein [Novosphingobium sp. BK267]MBB3450473.1 regulatory protein [Novosphingobium sp. BK352]MBB3478984.1 regulatory protein [Novosphingobium sp. BK369]MBB3502298.1 regulatory protein [Novosphingobium sp. BK336]MBB3538082.1 regulatory protein [Novosphingobium sp. BK486]MBB3557479.1 regulatory protein [